MTYDGISPVEQRSMKKIETVEPPISDRHYLSQQIVEFMN